MCATRATNVLPTTVVPSREFRLLLDGVKHWIDRISRPTGGPVEECVGSLEGPDGQGRSLLVEALAATCRTLGIRFAGGSCGGPWTRPGRVLASIFGEAVLWAAQDSVTRSAIGNLRRDGGAALRGVLGDSLLESDEEGLANIDSPGPEWQSLGSELDRSRAMDAIAVALIELARYTPTIVVFEDVESSDPWTAGVLAHLLRLLAVERGHGGAHRLLVLTTSELAWDEQPFARDSRDVAALSAFRIQVRGYSRDDIDEYARGAGIEISLTQREALYRSTGGNVRQVRHLLGARGGTEERGFGLVLSDLPRLLKARYRDLTDLERELVSTLAVLGFPLSSKSLRSLLCHSRSVVQGAQSISDAELASILGDLEARSWLSWVDWRTRDEDRRMRVDPELRPLIVAFESSSTLTSVARRLLVASIEVLPAEDATAALLRFLDLEDEMTASVLESISSDELARLVESWRTAVSLSAGPAPEIALDLIEKGRASIGDRNLASSAFEFESRWLELLEDAADHREALEARLRRANLIQDRVALAAEWRAIGRLAGQLGESDLEEASFRRADACLDGETGEKAAWERFRIRSARSRSALRAGRLDAAWSDAYGGIEALDELLRSSEDSDAGVDIELEILDLAQEIAQRRHDRANSEALAQRSLELRRAFGDIVGLATSLSRVGTLAHQSRDVSAARRYFLERLDLARRHRARLWIARAERRLGEFLADERCVEDARSSLREACRIFHAFGSTEDSRRALVRWVELEVRSGDFDEASRLLAESAGLDRESAVVSTSRDGANFAPREARELERQTGTLRLDLSQIDRAALAPSRAPIDPERSLLQAQIELEGGRPLAALQRFTALTEESGGAQADSSTAILAWLWKGRIEALLGSTHAALESYEMSLKRSSSRIESGTLAEAYSDVGAALLGVGQAERAFELVARGLRRGLGSTESTTVVHVVLRFAELLVELSRVRSAARVARVAASIARSAADFRSELRALALVVRAATATTDSSSAAWALARGREIATALPAPIEITIFRVEEAWAAYKVGDLDEALRIGRSALETARALGLVPLVSEAHLLVACIDGDPANPRNNVVRALESFEQLLRGDAVQLCPRLRYQVLRAAALFYLGRGKPEVANDFSARADLLLQTLRDRLAPELRHLAWDCRAIRHSLAGSAREKRPVHA
jgi:tetratricopeptide (TPR) repeat protein